MGVAGPERVTPGWPAPEDPAPDEGVPSPRSTRTLPPGTSTIQVLGAPAPRRAALATAARYNEREGTNAHITLPYPADDALLSRLVGLP